MIINSEGAFDIYNDFTIDNGSPEMYFKTGSSHYRWMIAAQENVDAALEITPSTTVGGGTYSTPVAVFKATGNVGIGTSSPDTLMHLESAGSTGANLRVETTHSSGIPFVDLKGAASSQIRYIDETGTIQTRIDMLDDGEIRFVNAAGATERMRITSGGNVLVGTTSVVGSALLSVQTSGGRGIGFNDSSSTAGTKANIFLSGGTEVGSISTTSTATSYNTSSDYRLKENVVDMTGALDRVDQLEPKRFNFIADEDTTVDGFLAHEVQDIVPEAVTGDKDAVDEDGNDIYQGIDQSKLVPLLVGAIKELNAKVAALEAQINN